MPPCCLSSSPDCWLVAVSYSFSCTLSVVLSRSGVSSTAVLSRLVRAGSLYPLCVSFLVSCLFLLVPSWGIHLPPLTALSFMALLGSASPVHPSLLARFVRPLLPFLLFLGFRSVGLLLWGPLLGLCRSPSHMLCGSLFPVFGVFSGFRFAPSAAPLLHPALLVAVASLHFFLCCWSACPACGSSGLCCLALCLVCCRSFLV